MITQIIKQCPICSSNFYTNDKRILDGRGKTCSKKCGYEIKKKRITLNCIICNKEVSVKPSLALKLKEGKTCSKKCYAEYMSKIGSKRVIKGFIDNNRNMRTGCGITTDGYVWMYKKGSGHHNQIKLHRYLMEIKLGRKILASEIVHHIDENKLNNVIENLQIVTRSEHNKIHRFLCKN